MHAIDMQMQARPAPQKELKEKPKIEQSEKTDAEPAKNGDSFLAMIQKILAAGKEENQAEKTGFSEETVQKEAGVKEATGLTVKPEASKNKAPNSVNYLKDSQSDNILDKIVKTEASAKTFESKVQQDTIDDKKMLDLLLKENQNITDFKDVLPKDLKDDEKILLVASNSNLKDDLDSKKVKAKNTLNLKNVDLDSDKFLTKSKTKENGGNLNLAQKNNENLGSPAKQNKPLISVEDLRNPQMQADATVHKAGSETRVETENSVDMVIDFRGKGSGTALAGDSTNSSQSSQNTEKGSSSFQAMLAQEIRESATDFVQAGKIVLKNNEAGEIRLQLRPENLGTVKIQLKLAKDKKISGTVVVSSKEAYDAFEDSIDLLAKEFEKNGFNTANFDLNWQDNSKNDQQFAESLDSLNNLSFQDNTENLRQAEKNADNLNAYSYIYGETINILV